MGTLRRILRRFILKQRIAMLRADMAMAAERLECAQLTADSLETWFIDAHRKLRSLHVQLACIERPEKLLAEALRHE